MGTMHASITVVTHSNALESWLLVQSVVACMHFNTGEHSSAPESWLLVQMVVACMHFDKGHYRQGYNTGERIIALCF